MKVSVKSLQSSLLINSLSGGRDRITEEIPTNTGEQGDQAFANVEYAMKQASGKDWEQVYKVRCYMVPLDQTVCDHVIRNLRKYCPNH
ncbi:hypothetical protein EMCG_01955 [[Emmonsia] crescens]|uniref:Uncharacterized protein n=1 Tax=[Emmonsia] crescens TaxID=73230 RepID=A0A0G2J9C1_9EURO|nr:hypothetical protein EMCG_01955 [Emmonsia crescens UAMH 3008]